MGGQGGQLENGWGRRPPARVFRTECRCSVTRKKISILRPKPNSLLLKLIPLFAREDFFSKKVGI